MCICISIVLYLELYFACVYYVNIAIAILHMAYGICVCIYIYIQHTYHLIPNQDVDSLQCCCAYCVCESTDEYGFRVSICIWFVYVLCIYTYFYTILYQGSRTPLFVVPVDGKEFSQEKQLPAKQNLPSWWLVVATSQRRFWLNSCPLKNFSAAITCSSGKYKLEAKEVGMGIGKNLRPRRQILVHFKLSTLILRHA